MPKAEVWTYTEYETTECDFCHQEYLVCEVTREEKQPDIPDTDMVYTMYCPFCGSHANKKAATEAA